MNPVVELAGISVEREGRVVLDVPALTVLPGEVLAVIGPNGAGKSSLLRVMGALESPAAGTVRFQGLAVSAAQALAVRRRMASVFQEPLLADATVFDNVAMGLRFRGADRARIEAQVARWLTRFEIAALAGRQARTLSGGEAQRAALARALVVEPELLLLDEPFSALDAPTREGLIDDLGRVLRAERITTVLVTHDHEAVVGCRVLSSIGGVSTIEVGGQTMEVEQRAEPGEEARLCLRAEDVTLKTGTPPPGASLPPNRLKGAVSRLHPVGLHVRVAVDCGFPLTALVTHRAVEELGLGEGVEVTVQFKATAPHLLLRGKP